MPTITGNKTIHVIGDTPLPEYTLAELVEGQSGYVFTSSGVYLSPTTPYEFEPRNETREISLFYRALTPPTYDNVSAGITDNTSDLTKTGADGYSGAVANEITERDFTVQFSTPTVNKTLALSVQTGITTYSFLDPACDYAFVFLANGTWSIWKSGVAVNGKYGNYEADDTALIHYKDDLLYFYLVRDEEWALLYTTRPTWSFPIIPVFTLYTNGAVANTPLIWAEEVSSEGVAALDVQAVLEVDGDTTPFRPIGWGNASGLKMTGERIEMSGGGFKSAKTEPKEVRRFIVGEVAEGVSEVKRANLETFVRAHSHGESFHVLDYSRGGASAPQTWTGHFESDFSDPKTSANTGSVSITIMESAFDLPI